MARKTPKATVKKAHRIARAIARKRKGKKPSNVWAVGMAVAKKSARKRKASRKRR